MRILNYLFFSAVLVVIVSVVGFLFSRELVLFLARLQIDQSLTELSKARATGKVQSVCLERAGVVSQELITYQIRFTSSTEYILEGICPGFTAEPVAIGQKKLPMFTTKALGGSGFMLKPAEHGIVLEAFRPQIDAFSRTINIDLSYLHREKTLITQNGSLTNKTNKELLGSGPVASCGGYGYTCCDGIAQAGQGDQLLGVLGCEQTCFAQCVSRPVILSFNSNPFPDQVSRTVVVPANEAVQFNYTISSSDSTLEQVQISFGDGSGESLSDLFGQTSHIYTCPKSSCQYTASVTAVDKSGNQSVQTTISKLSIVVQ